MYGTRSGTFRCWRWWRRLSRLAAYGLVTGGGGGVSDSVSAEEETTTVRIAAQRLESGRTAFALQVGEGDGWGERIEPRLNVFRRVADATVGRWSNSTLLELESGHTVRISARALEDGRIEFALQEIIDGEPAERILPRLRKFPVNSTVGKWLYSSAIDLGTAESDEPTAEEPPEPTYVPIVNVSGQASANIRYSVRLHGEDLYTDVWSTASVDSAPLGDLAFSNSCWMGHLRRITIGHFEPTDADFLDVILEIDGVVLPSQSWHKSPVRLQDGTELLFVESPDVESLNSRLQGSSALTVTIDGSGLPPVTFDLTGMFDTPVQENIDECGNYKPGETRELTTTGTTTTGTYVPIVNAAGQASAAVSYNSGADSQGLVHTSLRSKTAFAAGQQGQLTLLVRCFAGSELIVEMTFFDDLDDHAYDVSMTLDGQPSEESATWQRLTPVVGNLLRHSEPERLLEQLRGASEVTFDVLDSGLPPVTFDLTGMFDTPIQENIDECGNYKPGETRELTSTGTYVPLVNVIGQASANVRYSASVIGGDPYTNVWSTASVDSAPEGVLEFTNSCWLGDWRRITVGNFEPTDADFLDVTLEIDGVALSSQSWREETVRLQDGTELSYIESPDALSLASQLRGVSSLTVTIDGSGLPPVTFDLTGMFDTPVQENIDECGNYKEGETREPEASAPTDSSGEVETGDEGTTVSWSHSRGPGAIPSANVTQIRRTPGEEGVQFYIRASCSHTGTQLILFGTQERRIGDLEVSWSLDGATAQRETWRVSDWYPGFTVAHPVSALPVLQAWRNGQALELTVHTTTPQTEQVNLTVFFGTMAQSSLDECMAAPAAVLPTPAGEVSAQSDGNVSYSSGMRLGNHLATTNLSLTADWSTSSFTQAAISCGSEGVRVSISSAAIAGGEGETIAVSWQIGDGASQPAAWDIWPWPPGGGYVISPQDDAAFYAAIKDADSLTVSIGSDPATTLTLDFAGNSFWSTPVQPNLDACPGS